VLDANVIIVAFAARGLCEAVFECCQIVNPRQFWTIAG
jgi:hypothetical protein